MPNHILGTTPNFSIVWWSGSTSQRGLFITRLESSDRYKEAPTGLDRFGGEDAPECFIELEWVPGLITDLRRDAAEITLLNRVSYPFVPFSHRRPKKDGGDPALAYYVPLDVAGVERAELADALELACSRENATQAEADNCSEGYYVLNNQYLDGDVWRSMSSWIGDESYDTFYGDEGDEVKSPIEMPAHQLAIAPKQRFRAPSGGANLDGASLREARSRRRCLLSPCIAGRWIEAGETYIARQGAFKGDSHIKCAFRNGNIPKNWLNPHFEQYHRLALLGFEGWIKEEHKKMVGFDPDKFDIPWGVERAKELLTMLRDGYQLDAEEKREWRAYLSFVPIDIEPYSTLRKLLGMTNF